MRKLIICDQNPEVIKQARQLIKEYGFGVFDEVEVVKGDVIKVHEKTPNSKIVTASNPQFSPDCGLDYTLSKKYDWQPKEFGWSDDLFYVVSVDSDRRSTKQILLRAAVGILGYSTRFVPILTGLGTGVGGVAVEVFIEVLKAVLSNLRSADLSSANLSYANLRSANLSYANLRSANLSYADLRSADLSSANLRYADLSSANLRSANLRYADLSSANLRSANLRYANLRSANLSYANLRSANLRSADLSYADLSYADLSSAKNPPYQRHSPLSILRFQTGKLRAYKFVNKDGSSPINSGLVYKVGKVVREPDFEKNDMKDCAKGINLATLEWCEREREGKPIIELEFNAKDIISVPYVSDGKFRVKRCKVLRFVSEKEIKKLLANTRSYDVS